MTTEWLPWDTAASLKTTEDIILYLEAVFEDADPLLVSTALRTVARALGRSEFVAADTSDLASVIRQLKSLGFELTAKAA